jgi:peptidoglycan/LPS O-acetylase OafA/YrhL
LAILWRQGWLKFSPWRHDLVRDLSFGCGMVVFYLLIAGNSHWRGTAVALMFMGFTYLAFSPVGAVKRLCEQPWLRHLGTYSYGMYVFHQMFRVVFEMIFRQPLTAFGLPLALVQVLYIGLAFAATYGLARLSWRWLEKPFLDRK